MPHIHDLIDYTVEVFIVHNNCVLIRLHDKYNIRTCPGGHIELDEHPNDAAIREAKEETGLDITLYDGHMRYRAQTKNQQELIPPIFMNMHRVWSLDHHHIWLVYFAYASSDVVEPLHESDASHDWQRMSKHDLQQATNLEEHVKVYATAALDAYNTNA